MHGSGLHSTKKKKKSQHFVLNITTCNANFELELFLSMLLLALGRVFRTAIIHTALELIL